MKKQYLLISSFILTILAAQNSFATSHKSNYYAGADILNSNVKHRLSAISVDTTLPANPNDNVVRDNNRYGFSLNLGYRLAVNEGYFIAPEVFYDKMNSESYDFYHSDAVYPAPSNRLKVHERYGFKVNLGYNLSDLDIGGVVGHQLSKVSIFTNAGVARVSYRVSLANLGRADDSFKIAPIYGVGLIYSLNDSWSAKFAYDMQSFATRYLDNGLRDSVSIKTARLGVIYNF